MEWFLVGEKDKSKELSLTFTASEWQMIRTAMQDYSHVIYWHDFPKEAQLKITNALKSNFGTKDCDKTNIKTANELEKMIVDCGFSNYDPLRAVFIDLSGKPNEKARKIGIELNKIGGLKAMLDTANALLSFCKNNGYSTSDVRELEYCWDGIGEWCA